MNGYNHGRIHLLIDAKSAGKKGHDCSASPSFGRSRQMHPKIFFKSGSRFGKLTVICELPSRTTKGHRQVRWFSVRCDCGKDTIATYGALRHSRKKSCGCLNTAVISTRGGITKHPLFQTWKGMRDRCNDPKHQAWKRYGGRGIAVHQEWLDNPNSFYDWGMSNGWHYGLQLHRRKNDEGYSPLNCQWLTKPDHKAKHQQPKANMADVLLSLPG
jgi:hypothetical protein